MRRKRSKTLFRSMAEFEKAYLPKLVAEKVQGEPRDADPLGLDAARKSLDEARKRLSGQAAADSPAAEG